MFGVLDEITNMTRSLECPRGKYSYIGRLYTDTEMVPIRFRDFSEYREAIGTPRES